MFNFSSRRKPKRQPARCLYKQLASAQSGDLVELPNGEQCVFVASTACRPACVVRQSDGTLHQATDFLVEAIGLEQAEWRERRSPLAEPDRRALGLLVRDRKRLDPVAVQSALVPCKQGVRTHKHSVRVELKSLRV